MTTAIIEADRLGRRYGAVDAVEDVSFTIPENTICGLLGRNGAGKSTLMQLITGQEFPTSGHVLIAGENPVENAGVLSRVAFVKESQKYPDDFRSRHVFSAAPSFFEHWDAEFAARLVEEFRLPLNTRIKKLSRGQLSSIGVIVGLAARAPITLLDEPYLGLDAVARQLFYDTLLADYAAHPRTILLSTHLIDEVADLLEHVLVIDNGRIVIDAAADDLRGRAMTVVGRSSDVEAFVAGRTVLHRDGLGALASVTIDDVTPADRAAATAAGLELGAVSLQQLIVRATSSDLTGKAA
jgi:ABC-2 type transport system ATP-binding protein